MSNSALIEQSAQMTRLYKRTGTHRRHWSYWWWMKVNSLKASRLTSSRLWDSELQEWFSRLIWLPINPTLTLIKTRSKLRVSRRTSKTASNLLKRITIRNCLRISRKCLSSWCIQVTLWPSLGSSIRFTTGLTSCLKSSLLKVTSKRKTAKKFLSFVIVLLQTLPSSSQVLHLSLWCRHGRLLQRSYRKYPKHSSALSRTWQRGKHMRRQRRISESTL